MYNKNEKKNKHLLCDAYTFFFLNNIFFFLSSTSNRHSRTTPLGVRFFRRSLIRLFEIFVGDRKIPVAPTLFRYPLVQLYGVLCQRRRRVGRFGQRLAQVHVFQQQVGFETFLRVGGK